MSGLWPAQRGCIPREQRPSGGCWLTPLGGWAGGESFLPTLQGLEVPAGEATGPSLCYFTSCVAWNLSPPGPPFLHVFPGWDSSAAPRMRCRRDKALPDKPHIPIF